MTVRHLKDLSTPIGDVLKDIEDGGVLLKSDENHEYALIPLNDDLIDFLIERNPKFIDECREIRQRMESGRSRSHEEVKRLLQSQ